MARKLVFGLSYLTCVFLLSRIVDVVVRSYELTSLSLVPVRTVVDPTLLSVKSLKGILESRGISYSGLVEKKELHELVFASGDISSEELRSISVNEEDEAVEVSELTSGSHFFEVVEDTKDSAWIVIVLPVISGLMTMNRVAEEWKEVVRKTSRFGIRSARFDCDLDPGFCESRNWTSARLLLSVPKHETWKGDVILKQFLIRSSFSSWSIFRWIRHELAARVRMIDSASDLTHNWLQTKGSATETMTPTRVVLISRLETPPLLLSALAIKFNGRATFGMFRVANDHHRLRITGNDFTVPEFVISNESIHLFGRHVGEALSFRSVQLFMKSFNPEMNDIFSLSLVLVNIVATLDLFWIRCSKLWKHLLFWSIHAVKLNCCLFFVWLAILTLCGMPSLRPPLNQLLFCLHSIASTSFASVVRHDAGIYYDQLSILASAYLICGICVAVVRRKFFSRPQDFDDDELFRDWSPVESTILNYILFRPIGISVQNASSVADPSLEDGMEQLIERLAVPNLWLQDDMISHEYINSLPVWLHSEPGFTESESNNEDCMDRQRSSSASEVSEADQANAVPAASHIVDWHSTLRPPPNKEPSPATARKRHLLSGRRSKARVAVQAVERDVRQESVAPAGSIRSTECAICLEVYKQKQILCGLPCGHSYHESCILPWLLRDNHICPTCRWPSNKAKVR